MSASSEPAIPSEARIVLFDGECELCSGWAQFVARRDPRKRLKLASIQSDAGQRVMAECGLPTDRFETMVFFDHGRVLLRSSAFLGIVRHLTWPWPLLRVTAIVPRALRDWVYDGIARRRYRWFGKRDVCWVPSEEHRDRFL